jgi:hypothetical protein
MSGSDHTKEKIVRTNMGKKGKLTLKPKEAV